MARMTGRAVSGISDMSDTALLSALHAAAFPAPWSQHAFGDLLDKSGAKAYGTSNGFILMQKPAAGESEILTLAVIPTARRQGLAGKLIAHALEALALKRVFLEVAADNHAARALYEKLGFIETGRRAAYYKKPDGSRVDGVLMRGDFAR